jgi:AAA+ ATPase superfamily predicted ATPase
MFIGRKSEISQLHEATDRKLASLIVVYGRRRIGKTTLIEQTFAARNVIKIEGVEGKDEHFQIDNFVRILKSHCKNKALEFASPRTWTQVFQLLALITAKGKWTIYLEELQWMANYRSDLIAELKPIWDSSFSKNNQLVFILCGSSPSFFITQILRSRALHNRSSLDLRLEEFPLSEAEGFLKKKSSRALFDAYLTVGGIPPYLEKLNTKSSVYLSLCHHSFRKDSFFSVEFEKVFVSSFGSNPTYRQIVELLSQKGNMTRDQIAHAVKKESGGTLSNLLIDLEECGFIRRVVPLDKSINSLLGYYQIRDPYLHFYFKFIHKNLVGIRNGDYDDHPEKLLDLRSYSQWLGFSFERFCRQNVARISELLGFSAVQFKAGAYFRRGTLDNFGSQVDLLFKRADGVNTVCEVKYQDAPVGIEVIKDVESKIAQLDIGKSRSIQRVLITASDVSKSLRERSYFDRVIELDQLLQK